MSRKPVVYRLESQRAENAAWVLVLDEHLDPITFKGRGSKAQALTMAALLLRWPSFYGLRVMKSGDPKPVKEWAKSKGTNT